LSLINGWQLASAIEWQVYCDTKIVIILTNFPKLQDSPLVLKQNLFSPYSGALATTDEQTSDTFTHFIKP
jgi:hypothetical protein